MGRRLCGYDICPYGHLSWIIPVVTFFATWFFLFPAFRCSLTVARSRGGDFEIWYGYWNLESSELAVALGPEDDSNVCIKWGSGRSRQIFDEFWKLGKSIGVIGAFTTILAAAANCFLFWSRMSLGWFYPLIGVHVLNSFFSFMLLIGLRSNLCAVVSCVLGRAGYVAIIAGFLWLITAFLLYLVRRKEAEMATNPNGVDLKDIEEDQEEMLALPAPDDDEEQPLALPAPGDEYTSPEGRKKKKTPSSARDVPLALPPSESSPKPSSSRTNSAKSPRKSPRKGTRPTTTTADAEVPTTPRKTSTKSPKKGTPKTGTPKTPTSSAGGKKKKKKPATKPADIPEI